MSASTPGTITVAADVIKAGALVVPQDLPAVVGADRRVGKTARQLVEVLVAEADALVVDSEEKKTIAVSLLGVIGGIRASAETERKKLVEPLKKFTDGVDTLFRDTLKPLLGDGGADERLRRKVTDFNQAERERIATANALAEAERIRSATLLEAAQTAQDQGEARVADALLETAAAADTTATKAAAVATSAAPPPRTFSTPFGTRATSKTEWDLAVVNLDDVPREYLVLDEVRIRREIRAGTLRPGPDGSQPIPGLRIFEREALSVRP